METTNTIVFDIGNVLVRWSPSEIVHLTFGDSVQHEKLIEIIFKSEIWIDLNKGKLSEIQAKENYIKLYHFSSIEIDTLFYYVKNTQILIYQMRNLLEKLSKFDYKLYALTDNILEIIHFLKEKYDFWQFFDGSLVSAEIGILKPNKTIFEHLMNKFSFKAENAIFIDDFLPNILSAKELGFKTIHFKNAQLTEKQLKNYGVLI